VHLTPRLIWRVLVRSHYWSNPTKQSVGAKVRKQVISTANHANHANLPPPWGSLGAIRVVACCAVENARFVICISGPRSGSVFRASSVRSYPPGGKEIRGNRLLSPASVGQRMGWEDQGRQEHGWFGSGTAPEKSTDPSGTGDAFGPGQLVSASRRSAMVRLVLCRRRSGRAPRLNMTPAIWRD